MASPAGKAVIRRLMRAYAEVPDWWYVAFDAGGRWAGDSDRAGSGTPGCSSGGSLSWCVMAWTLPFAQDLKLGQ